MNPEAGLKLTIPEPRNPPRSPGKEGVLHMISTCGKFLSDPEVSELFDAVNARGAQGL